MKSSSMSSRVHPALLVLLAALLAGCAVKRTRSADAMAGGEDASTPGDAEASDPDDVLGVLEPDTREVPPGDVEVADAEPLDAEPLDAEPLDGDADGEDFDGLESDAGDSETAIDAGEPDAGPAPCDNATLDPGETDVDCGGACDPCANTKFCKAHSDCLSATCIFGVCESPACDDDVVNGKESDVDCGGDCEPCGDGLVCTGHEDCASARCTDGVCISCHDALPNGDETGTDCGGSCAPCGLGEGCVTAADCAGGALCHEATCCAANACGACGALPPDLCDGADNDCDGATDEDSGGQSPPPCPKILGVCAGAVAACAGGWSCSETTYATWSDQYEGPAEVSCDSLDNDCDGQTDEGLLNACGGCGAAPAEVCNGLDDDCDGQTDDGVTPPPDLGCGAVGVCTGVEPTCQGAAGWSCGAPGSADYQAAETACDGLDNDCDGETDESALCAVCPSTTVRTVFSADQWAEYEPEMWGQIHPHNDDLYSVMQQPGYGAVVARAVSGDVITKIGFQAQGLPLTDNTGFGVTADSVWVTGSHGGKPHAIRFDLALTEVLDTFVVTGGYPALSLPSGPFVTTAMSYGDLVAGQMVVQSTLEPWSEHTVSSLVTADRLVTWRAPHALTYRSQEGYPDGSTEWLTGLWIPATGGKTMFGDDIDGVRSLVWDASGTLHVLAWANGVGGSTLYYQTWDGSGALSAAEPIPGASTAHGRLYVRGATPRVIYEDASENLSRAIRQPDGTWTSEPWYNPSGSSLWGFWLAVDSAQRLHLLWRDGYTAPIRLKVFCNP